MHISPRKTLVIGMSTIGVFILILLGSHAWDLTKRVDHMSQLEPVINTSQVVSVEVPKSSKLDWASLQFDACGSEQKYSQLPWWGKFMEHAEKVDYYNSTYIQSALKSINEDTYRNPEKKIYSHDEFCVSPHGDASPICVGRYKKLTQTDFKEYGEGCLSKDGKGFVAVFPGEYMGGGNHIFRYDIADDVFEEASKVNETVPDDHVWVAPPDEFGKRHKNIIKMSGASGDAGWLINTVYDYNFVDNIVKIVMLCSGYAQEKPSCEKF